MTSTGPSPPPGIPDPNRAAGPNLFAIDPPWDVRLTAPNQGARRALRSRGPIRDRRVPMSPGSSARSRIARILLAGTVVGLLAGPALAQGGGQGGQQGGQGGQPGNRGGGGGPGMGGGMGRGFMGGM